MLAIEQIARRLGAHLVELALAVVGFQGQVDAVSDGIGWRPLAPLLKEEIDAGVFTLIAKVERPLLFHGTCHVAGLAPHDHPIEMELIVMALNVAAIDVSTKIY